MTSRFLSLSLTLAGLLGVVSILAGFLAPSLPSSDPQAGPRALLPEQSTPSASQRIVLEKGWNLVSSHIAPNDPSLEAIFASIAPAIERVEDEEGRVYEPGRSVNEIGYWNAHEGYLVYASSAQTLRLEGTALDPTETISLEQGWNLIPYVPLVAIPAEQALSSIREALVAAKDVKGRVYYPEQNTNQIGDLEPGRSYKVYVTQAIDLTYPVVSDETYYAGECLTQPDAHKLSEYGTLVPGADVTTERRIENARVLNTAIAQVPSGGTLCLPGGDYYLHPDSLYRGTANIWIKRDSITIWGAGRNDDGNGTGLHTRSEYSVIDGKVVRGHGLKIVGTPWNSDVPPRQHITIRDLELDGGAGYTGNFGWPADPETGDGWDISHKGILPSDGNKVDNVTLERIWLHSYRGEMIYVPGFSMGRITINDIISEDTNASTYNVLAKEAIVTNSEFGKSRMWIEIGVKRASRSSIFQKNTFHDAEISGAIVLTQGDGSQQSHVFEDNRFEDCNFNSDKRSGAAFLFNGGIGGPISVKNNVFINCEGFTTTVAGGNIDVHYLQNISFEQNEITMSRSGSAFYFMGEVHNMVVQNNKVNFAAPDVGTSAVFCCGVVLNNVEMTNNTFHGGRTPEYAGELDGTHIPLLKENQYIDAKWRLNKGRVYIGPTTDSLVTPLFERTIIYPFNDTTEIFLGPTVEGPKYADGQKTTILIKRSPNPGDDRGTAHFAKGNSTYIVDEDRYLVPGDSVQFRFDGALEQWVAIP